MTEGRINHRGSPTKIPVLRDLDPPPPLPPPYNYLGFGNLNRCKYDPPKPLKKPVGKVVAIGGLKASNRSVEAFPHENLLGSTSVLILTHQE